MKFSLWHLVALLTAVCIGLGVLDWVDQYAKAVKRLESEEVVKAKIDAVHAKFDQFEESMNDIERDLLDQAR